MRIDAIGLQTHMHQGYWGEEKTLGILDRFARFGLPLHMTETTLRVGPPHAAGDRGPQRLPDPDWPSTPEGEERQADEIVRHYRPLVGHPAVQSVNYWGLTDRGAWLGAPVGLVRADGTPKPAYDALRGLIKGEWWLPPTELRTDSEGRVTVQGFFGEYRVSAAGGHAPFTIEPGVPAQRVTIAGRD